MRKIMIIMALLASSLLLSSCLTEGNIQEDGTDAVIAPAPPPADSFVCNPFEESDPLLGREQGILGSLYYTTPDQPQYSSVNDYITYGQHVEDINLYFNQLFVPTRPFDRGFVTQAGEPLLSVNGDTLYEWFAIRFRGRMHLGPSDPQGPYQLAVLSDDGAILRLQDINGNLVDVINNDGNHPTKMGCGTTPIDFASGDKIPFELDYHQGPRYHIAMIMLWRPWPANPADVNDPLCGKAGNSLYFDSTQNPPTPKPAFQQLLDRGWRVMAPENYSLPETQASNPCNEPAPVISNVAVSQITKTSVVLTWTTDIPATSQAVYVNGLGVSTTTTEDMTYVTSHSHLVTGLSANTIYQIKAVSRSSSGLSAESGFLTMRTAR